MFNSPSRNLFLSTLILGTLISVSSQSWFGAWVGLEVNLLSFIPLMTDKNMLSSEAALKYFLTQALASIFLFTTILLYTVYLKVPLQPTVLPISIHTLFWSALLIKLGAAPFHFWLPGVMEGLTWINNMLLMTWQKLGPLSLLSYAMSDGMFPHGVIILSTFVGAVGGFNQTSLRKIMAYSSINHLGWMLAGVLLSNLYWVTYFGFYCFLSFSILVSFHHLQLSHLKQIFLISDPNNFNKIFVFSNFLSLGGLPPFIGFIPKWLVLQGLTSQGNFLLGGTLVVLTLVVLFYYLRTFFPAALVTTSSHKWGITQIYWAPLNVGLTSLSLLGFPLFPLLYPLF
uniref:NADH-ubiquinone oxidoreductase chain 2 n=1 Tax=Ephemerella sp. Yunnan-2018 TaxID=2748056 RepID=A0A7D6JA80_9INSE|nr:NADH dehydrogenase subunit 2 [Ephemerella sp. Yunnan-2018]QLP88956.1 NADH dehydrogenase subunit 2 [Ephemerella sp. Yunnan-2018]